jgi:hypothetical protein
MRRFLVLLVAILAALLCVTGCKSKSKTVEKTDLKDVLKPEDVAEADVIEEVQIISPDIPLLPDNVPDFTKPQDALPDFTKPQDADEDGLPGDVLPQDVEPDVWAPQTCQSHEDCDNGLCIEVSPGSGKFVCAPYCLEECPQDWECKSVYVDGPDPISLCFPPTETLCMPCAKDSECLFAGSLCIKGNGALGYCGKLCDLEDPACPEGYECAMAKGKNGENLAPQCMPPAGFCCVANKLKSCDDSNPCTLDTCDPSFGCKHTNVDGPCNGPEDCTKYQCINGACIGIPVTLDVTLDGIDDDCDGLTDEDWAYGLDVPFHAFSSSMGTVSGGGITVKGALSTPPVGTVSAGGDFKVTPVTTKIVAPEDE